MKAFMKIVKPIKEEGFFGRSRKQILRMRTGTSLHRQHQERWLRRTKQYLNTRPIQKERKQMTIINPKEKSSQAQNAPVKC